MAAPVRALISAVLMCFQIAAIARNHTRRSVAHADLVAQDRRTMNFRLCVQHVGVGPTEHFASALLGSVPRCLCTAALGGDIAAISATSAVNEVTELSEYTLDNISVQCALF